MSQVHNDLWAVNELSGVRDELAKNTFKYRKDQVRIT